jgi:hypothetical protein
VTADGFRNGSRNSEIGDYGMPEFQEDVLGLDVAMDYALTVRVVKRLGHFTSDPERICQRELRLLLEPLA